MVNISKRNFSLRIVLCVLLMQFVFLQTFRAQTQAVNFAGSVQAVSESKPEIVAKNGLSDMPPPGSIQDAEALERKRSELLRRREELTASQYRLFTSAELLTAWEQTEELFACINDFPAAENIKLWRNSLLADRCDTARARAYTSRIERQFMPVRQNDNQEAVSGYSDAEVERSSNKLREQLGETNYTDLHFCLQYLGVDVNDAILWNAYFFKHMPFVNAVFNCAELKAKRHGAFIIALEVKRQFRLL